MVRKRPGGVTVQLSVEGEFGADPGRSVLPATNTRRVASGQPYPLVAPSRLDRKD
jgi:hypothetical protein